MCYLSAKFDLLNYQNSIFSKNDYQFPFFSIIFSIISIQFWLHILYRALFKFYLLDIFNCNAGIVFLFSSTNYNDAFLNQNCKSVTRNYLDKIFLFYSKNQNEFYNLWVSKILLNNSFYWWIWFICRVIRIHINSNYDLQMFLNAY